MIKYIDIFCNATPKQVDEKWAKEQSVIKRCFFWKDLMSNWLETSCINWNHREIQLSLHKEWVRHFEIQDMSVIWLQKERQKQAKRKNSKSEQKPCPSQININLFTKDLSNNNFMLHCVFQMARGQLFFEILWKETINLQKLANMQKSQLFYENSLYQEPRSFEENNTVINSKR